jgi:hypothetical protein
MATKKDRLGLQTKLKVHEPGDSYEQEADRVADQVLATPTHHDISGAPLRIQRLSGQSHGEMDPAPASVDQALASPGRPLEPGLRQEMEERFGYDFSRVRVHSGTIAEQSAEDVNAHAYTVGHDIVLGTGMHERRQMIAHELAHVVQQSSADGNGVAQWNGGRDFSPGSILSPQPVITTLQRKAKPSPGGSPSQQAVKAKPSQQTGSNKVSFLIYFDKPLTRSEFIELADMKIYGRPTPGDWIGVPEHLKASDSPIRVWVSASTVERELRAKIAALPQHIQNFLMKNIGDVGSSEDLQSVANAGFILEMAGVTEDELELSLLESPKAESSDLVTWAVTFAARRQEQEESERKYEEREQRRKAEEKELEKWRKRFAKYTDTVLDEKIAELRKEPESGTAKDWLPRFEKERARRRDVRRAQPVTGPETVDQAISMLEEAWRDAEKEDVPDVKRALELASRIDEWLQETASSDKYDKYFQGWFRTVAMQTVGMTKSQIHSIRFKLKIQGEDDWNRPTHLGGHWELGINSLKAAREYLEVMGAKKTIQQTSLHGLQEATSRILKYEAAGYATIIVAPVVIGGAIEAAPLLTTESLTAAGLRVAPRIMFWAARNPVLATEVGTAIVGTALQVGEDKYLDPVQLFFNLLHIYGALPGRGPSGTSGPTVPHQEGEPDFVITRAPQRDQAGKVTGSVIETASGRHLDAEVDPRTGNGQIVDRNTREVVGIISNGEIRRPAPALPQSGQAPTNAPPPKTAQTIPTARPPAPPAATGGTIGTPAPGPKLVAKTTQAPSPVQVSVPIVSAPQPKNVNAPIRTDIERARAKRAAAMQRPQAQTQRQVLAATGSTRDVAPAKVMGSSAQGTATEVQIVASGEGKAPGPDTPVPGSVRTSSETTTTSGTGRAGGTQDINQMIEEEIEGLPPPGTTSLSPPANQNVSGPPPEQAPPPAPAPPHQVHPHVLPGEGPVSPPRQAPSPEPVPSPPPEPDPLAPAPGEAGRVELSGGGGAQGVGPTAAGEIGEAQQFANRIVADPEFRQEYVERLRRAGYTRTRAQEVAGKYEREFEVRGELDAARRATLWRLFADMLGETPGSVTPSVGPGQPGSTAQGEISTTKFTGAPAETGAPHAAPAPPVVAGRRAALEGKPDWNKLPVPEGYRRPDGTIEIDRFGREVIQWGTGMEEAKNLVEMMNSAGRRSRAYLKDLRSRGVTPEMARAWAKEYQSFANNNPNPTAPWRAELLRLIAKLL